MRTAMLMLTSWGVLTTRGSLEQKGSCGWGVLGRDRDAPTHICTHEPGQTPHAQGCSSPWLWQGGRVSHVGSSCCLWPEALGAFTPLSSTAQIPSTCPVHGGLNRFLLFHYTDWLHMPILGVVGVYALRGAQHTRSPSEPAWQGQGPGSHMWAEPFWLREAGMPFCSLGRKCPQQGTPCFLNDGTVT